MGVFDRLLGSLPNHVGGGIGKMPDWPIAMLAKTHSKHDGKFTSVLSNRKYPFRDGATRLRDVELMVKIPSALR